jgi:hypothetical protein
MAGAAFFIGLRSWSAPSAFRASFSHRSPKFRQLSATSGEFASFTRRAHSAA